MKKIITLLVICLFTTLSFAQKVELTNMNFTSASRFDRTFNFSCHPGSDISYTVFVDVRSTSTNAQPALYIYLDDVVIVKNYKMYSPEILKFKHRILTEGTHKLRIQLDVPTTGASISSAKVYNGLLNKSLDSENGQYYQLLDDNTLCMVVPSAFEDGNVNIPESVSVPFVGDYSVSEIEDSLCVNNESVISVTIPESIKNIGEKAFYGCSNLQDVFSYPKQAPKCFQNSYPEGTKIHVFKDAIWYNAQVYSKYVIVPDLDEILSVPSLPYTIKAGSRCYDLNGRVTNASKGIVIKDGKKVLKTKF